MATHESWVFGNMVRDGLKWVAVILFVTFTPPLVLALIPHFIKFFFEYNDNNSVALEALYSDLPLIVVTYWAGCLGAILAHIYDKTTTVRAPGEPENDLSIIAPRFFLGGIIGVASFIFVKSNIIVHLIYPGLTSDVSSQKEIATCKNDHFVAYHSYVAIALISGLIGQSLVKKIRDAA